MDHGIDEESKRKIIGVIAALFPQADIAQITLATRQNATKNLL